MNSLTNGREVRILLIDDDEDDYILTRDLFMEMKSFTYQLDWENDYRTAKEKIFANSHDVYLVDFRLGEMDGLTLISEALEMGFLSPMILLTGVGDKQIDMEAMRKGASDYLVKSEISPELLERSIRYSLNHSQALKKISENEGKYRDLFERSIDAIYLVDLDFKLVDVNPSFCRLFGCDHAAVKHKSLKVYFKEESSFNQLLTELKTNSGQVKDFEESFTSANNETLICRLTMIERYNHDGEHIGYQGLIHDVTLNKRAEEQLLLAERLSMTGKLVRSIAHEVRNPLTNLELALNQLEDELNPESDLSDTYMTIAHRNVGRIDQLIKDLLNSSKPKELEMVTCKIIDVLEGALDLVKDRITLKGMRIERDYQLNSEITIEADPENVKIALLNILVNAVEAMQPNEGCLEVKTKHLNDSIYLLISDNGKGMTQADLEQLFDPFYTKKQDGMGLGLTTTQNIVHSHHGQIKVTSKLGEGTTFTICLPETQNR